jgi:hypothetical protein
MIKRIVKFSRQTNKSAVQKQTFQPRPLPQIQNSILLSTEVNKEAKTWRNKVRTILFHKCVCAHIDEQHEKNISACKMCDGKKFIRCNNFRAIDFLLVIDFGILLREEEEN